MTLYEFNLLNKQNQFSTLFTIGDYIDHVTIVNKKFCLYAINKFYVEVIYNSVTNVILGINTFKESSSRLDKYFK